MNHKSLLLLVFSLTLVLSLGEIKPAVLKTSDNYELTPHEFAEKIAADQS